MIFSLNIYPVQRYTADGIVLLLPRCREPDCSGRNTQCASHRRVDLVSGVLVGTCQEVPFTRLTVEKMNVDRPMRGSELYDIWTE